MKSYTSGNLYGIAAMTINGCIGKDGGLATECRGDMEFFKEKTTGKTVVFGRKTWESIGSKPLPKRKNFVISSSDCYAKNALVVHPTHVPDMAEKGDVFICGGAQIYKLFIPQIRTFYLTVINRIVSGDTFFPIKQLENNFFLKKTLEINSEYTIFEYENRLKE